MSDELGHKSVHIYNTPGDAHFLTYSCFKQQPFLAGETACEWFCASLASACVSHDIALWAYVIMPEHVHMLVKPRQAEYNISKFQASVKGSVAKKALSYRQRSNKPESTWARFYDLAPNGKSQFRFWQRGVGYDENIVDESGIPEILTYIHLNPVRRGLCSTPEDWPWSSAGDYNGTRVGPVRIDIINSN